MAQITYPLLSFPKIYSPVTLFQLDMEPLGLLPLLVGYGSIVGCVFYIRFVFRSFCSARVVSVPLALAAMFVLSLMSPADFVPVVVAFTYALAPSEASSPASSGASAKGWLFGLKRLVAESAAEARRARALGVAVSGI